MRFLPSRHLFYWNLGLLLCTHVAWCKYISARRHYVLYDWAEDGKVWMTSIGQYTSSLASISAGLAHPTHSGGWPLPSSYSPVLRSSCESHKNFHHFIRHWPGWSFECWSLNSLFIEGRLHTRNRSCSIYPPHCSICSSFLYRVVHCVYTPLWNPAWGVIKAYNLTLGLLYVTTQQSVHISDFSMTLDPSSLTHGISLSLSFSLDIISRPANVSPSGSNNIP